MKSMFLIQSRLLLTKTVADLGPLAANKILLSTGRLLRRSRQISMRQRSHLPKATRGVIDSKQDSQDAPRASAATPSKQREGRRFRTEFAGRSKRQRCHPPPKTARGSSIPNKIFKTLQAPALPPTKNSERVVDSEQNFQVAPRGSVDSEENSQDTPRASAVSRLDFFKINHFWSLRKTTLKAICEN